MVAQHRVVSNESAELFARFHQRDAVTPITEKVHMKCIWKLKTVNEALLRNRAQAEIQIERLGFAGGGESWDPGKGGSRSSVKKTRSTEQ